MIVAEVIPTFAIYTDTLSLSVRTAILTGRLFDYKRGECMDKRIILSALREILEEMCEDCGGCTQKCVNYKVIAYLIEQYEDN